MELSSETKNKNIFEDSIEPFKEMAAYEALWKDIPNSFKKIAEVFAKHPGLLPSEFVPSGTIADFAEKINPIIAELDWATVNVLIHMTYDYPSKLRDAEDPVELLYYMGDLGLLQTRSVSIVGARKASPEAIRRTQQLVRDLIKEQITIVSGLAEGVDTTAHTTAIELGGKTIAVIGTPLNEVYPKENKDLQKLIAKDHLLISQVPFWRYGQQDYRHNRGFFPERNKTMSALTEATIIVEASDTSGTLIQARAAIQQKRKLFILNNCFENPNISWPHRFLEKGAIRVRTFDDIKGPLQLIGNTRPSNETSQIEP
jgi:DNA processing protein